jgi:hypothetical protein
MTSEDNSISVLNTLVNGGNYNKEYYLKNREKLLDKSHKYWSDNKENLKIWRNEKIICICGGKYTKCNLSKHFRSAKHLNYITNN